MSKGLQITVGPPDIGVCNLPVNTLSPDGTHVVIGVNGFTLTKLFFQKILYTPPLIKAMKNHRAEERRA